MSEISRDRWLLYQNFMLALDEESMDVANLTSGEPVYLRVDELRWLVEQVREKKPDWLTGLVVELPTGYEHLSATVGLDDNQRAQERSRLRGEVDDLRQQVAQLEKERDMAFHAYDKLREEYLALTFEPVTPQLEDTFPEVGSEG